MIVLIISRLSKSNNWRKNRIFVLRKELFEKDEGYSVIK